MRKTPERDFYARTRVFVRMMNITCGNVAVWRLMSVCRRQLPAKSTKSSLICRRGDNSRTWGGPAVLRPITAGNQWKLARLCAVESWTYAARLGGHSLLPVSLSSRICGSQLLLQLHELCYCTMRTYLSSDWACKIQGNRERTWLVAYTVEQTSYLSCSFTWTWDNVLFFSPLPWER